MPYVRKRGDSFEITVKKAGVLDKPITATFQDETVGREWARNLEKLLARGIVPTDYQAPATIVTIKDLVVAYEKAVSVSSKDRGCLNTIIGPKGATPLTAINAKWVDGWIQEMKWIFKLAPATIRAKVGALARCTDWGVRQGHLTLPDYPFRSLPDGYAQYNAHDEKMAGIKREDVAAVVSGLAGVARVPAAAD